MNNKLSFTVENITPVEDDAIDKSQFSKLLVDCFSTAKSAHDTFISEETLKRTAKSILLKPFVFDIDKRFDDLSTHTEQEIAGGFVPHDSKIEFKRMADGSLMMSVEVLIWKRYSRDLLKYFERDGGRKSVSVEIDVFESRKDAKSGLLELVDFAYNCITGLGDLIRPAISNAQAVLQFSQEFETAKQDYEEQFSDKYSDIDFSIPKSVKRSASKALELRKEKGNGGTAESLSIARHLSRSEKSDASKVRKINKFFLRKNIYDNLVIGLYGGNSSKKWSSEISSKLEELDNQRVSYFNAEESVAENNEEENLIMKKQKSDAKVEEVVEEIEMAAPETPEKEEEKPEDKEEMAAPEKPETPEKEDGEKEEMAAPESEEKSEEKPAEEMAADAEKSDEKEELPEEEFSFGFSVEVAMSLFAELPEDEQCKMASEEVQKGKEGNSSKVMMGLFAACHAMSEKCKEMAAENKGLKEFKAEVESQQKQFSVDSTIKELTEKFAIPEETVEEMKAEAGKFEFAQIEGWKNFAKAKAVDFAVIGKKDGKEDVVRIGLPFSGSSRTKDNDLWK